MNRKVALLLVFCIILSIFALAACSNDAESHPDKAKESKPTVSDNPLLPKPSEDPEPTTVLGETEDAGSEYIDKLVFIGDSTTYGLKAYGMLSGGIGYTSALTRFAIEATGDTEILKKQLDDPDTDVICNLPFPKEDDVEPTA